MKNLSKALISAYILLSSISAISFLSFKQDEFKSLVKSNQITPKLSKENDKKWANQILNGGYILLFRHTERDKWIDVGVYDALESDLHENGLDNSRFAENDYFAKAVCLNSKGKIQAKAMKEIIDYSKLPIGYVLSSPSCRARQTADIAFGGYKKTSRDLVYVGPYSETNQPAKLKKLLLSLPIYENTNTIISAHNSLVKCKIFTNKYCDLRLEQGGFYVIEKQNQDLKLVYEFHNFQDFSRVFFKR
tara:strand:- start:941 stop:1681 length:741 start_codon:yes stop_codon:yes gene_type:complete